MPRKKGPYEFVRDLNRFCRDIRDCAIEIRKTLEFLGFIPRQEFKRQEEEPKRQFFDPYEVLGVSRDDPIEKIEMVYKKLAKIYHPDNQETGNEEVFKRINMAWRKINEGG